MMTTIMPYVSTLSDVIYAEILMATNKKGSRLALKFDLLWFHCFLTQLFFLVQDGYVPFFRRHTSGIIH